MVLYDNVHIYDSNHQLTIWVEVNGAVHVGREDKQVKQHYYVTSSQKLSHTSCVLSCSLVYFISGLPADMGATVISRDSEVIKC